MFQNGRIMLAQCGFNRYMVECEFVYKDSVSDVVNVLIDTWWNVNQYDILWII